jgi:hypothetical protein
MYLRIYFCFSGYFGTGNYKNVRLKFSRGGGEGETLALAACVVGRPRAGRPAVTLSKVAMGDPVLGRPAMCDPVLWWPAMCDPVCGGDP